MPDPSTAPPDRARGARRALPALVVALVVGASFSTALGGGFIWDDHNLIEHNRNIRELSDIPRAFTRRFWDTGYELGVPLANVYYRPLVTLSFAVDYQLWGGAARGFHLTNVLLHVAVSLLVYWLLLLLLRDEGATPANDNHSADSERGLGLPPAWVAAVGALIFALHPSRAEAVAWISGRTDVMMALFFVLALGLFYRALRDGPTPRRVALAWLAFVCAMLCKENAVALAVVVPAADALLLGRDRRAWLRNARWSHGPLIVLTLVFVAARVATGGERPGFDPTLLGRLNLIASSVGHYGWMFINGYQPNPAIGAGYHPGVIISGPLVGGIVTIVASLALLVFGLRRAPRVAWATTLLGATLAPVCNIVPLALVFLVADRFIYLPWLGVTLLVLLLLQSLPRRLSRVLLAVLLALATTWSVTVALRSRDFSSDYRFWLAAVTVDPENPLALRQLARELAQRGRYRAAERHLMMALQHARGEVALKA
ncbi:MAG: hypothetical protein KC503_44665, partial [Myxococcales bacterium]|nr:hypothetical protein [Myxococcales bacterium]